MDTFAPPTSLTIAFTVLTLLVALADVLILRRAAEPGKRARWTAIAAGAAVAWLALHASFASSGVLLREGFPPPVMFYVAMIGFSGVVVAFSPVGSRLAMLPLSILVGLQVFRLPLEVLLHALYDAGALPVQMTWSGYNFDVVTAILAIGVAGGLWRGVVPQWGVWVWNIAGSLLLVNVVGIALLSAPLPIRQFHNEPAVVLVFFAPYNWIVNVHVWTALVGHLVIFRALWSRRAGA